MSSSDELLLVQELPMDMQSDGDAGDRRLAHVLPPLARAPGPPPFRPPPPPSAVAAAEFRVAFRGWLGAPRHWELWVAKLRPIHERLWRELGIFDAVIASTYRLKRDASAVLHLASFWSPGTNTFAFPWGEATITLEDVAVLGGFPADGSPVLAPLPPQWGSDEAALHGVRLDFSRSACKKAHHAAWLKHFLTDTDMETVIEHAAFLALWLTRFVLPGHPESTMRQSLFPLAVRMARGDRVALGPAVLASLYQDLREMKTYLVSAGTFGGNGELLPPLSVHAPLYILQLWMWERFPVLCDGKANTIKDAEPRAARWHDVSNKIKPTVIRKVLTSEVNFLWKPYTSCQQACKHHTGWVRGSDITLSDEFISLAHCFRACELVGMDCIEQYLPHRVAMQFGLDQDVPGDVHRANEDWEVAWETYHLEGKNVAIFIPHSEPGVTTQYAQWWRQPLPSSDLGVGAGNSSVEGKVSKRKVKKTLAAMEAEAEKERKTKKARVSHNSDKKRKLEELYDAKLSNWLATARNGSSGTGGGPGGSCKRGSSPKYHDASDKPLLSSVGTAKDDFVPLVPGKQLSTSAVNLKKDRDMNLDRGVKLLTGSKYECANVKGYMAGDVDHPVNEPYFKEEAVLSTEISTFNEDAKGEWSNEILENTSELVIGETPDVPNRPEEFKPPMCMENEECSYHSSDVDFSEDDKEEAVIVDKPTIFSSGPEGGNAVMPEEKMVNLLEDKCLHATDTPEEGTTVTQELEKKANLAVDESCGISNRPEEVTALAMEEIEEKGNVAVDNEGTVVSQGVGRAAEGTIRSIEVVPGCEQGVYAVVVNIPQETVALAEEILPVQQANDVGECLAMSCIMEDASVAAGVRGTNDGETSLDLVDVEKREISCIEEIGGGESNQMSEEDIQQEPAEAPQVDSVECGEDIALVVKDNEGENENVTQTVEKVVTDNNMAAVLLGFPEKRADVDKALNITKKDTEDMHKEVVEVEDAKQVHIDTLENGGANEGHNEVAEVEHIDMTEAKMHAQFDTEKPEEAAEVGHVDMDDCKRSTGEDTDGEPGDVPEVVHTEVQTARKWIENNNDDKVTEYPVVAHAEMEEVESLMNEDEDEKFEEVFESENTRMCGTHGPLEEYADVKLNEVSDVVHAATKDKDGFINDDADNKFQETRELESIGMDGTHGVMVEDTAGKLNEVSDVVLAETKDTKDFMKEDADNMVQEISELESIGMDGSHGPAEEDTDGNLKEVPKLNAEVEHVNVTESDNGRLDSILQVDLPAKGEARCLVEEDIEEYNAKVPQVKHANLKDKASVEKDSKENPNADSTDLAEKEVDESKEGYQAKQTEREEHTVLRQKDTEEHTKNAFGAEQAEEQGETLTSEYMHGYIEDVTVAEQVDGQSEMLVKIGAEVNPEEITRAKGIIFDNDTMEPLKSSVSNEMLFSSAIIVSKEEHKDVVVDNVTEKQCLQDVELINERESLSDGAAMEIQGADDHKTLDIHDEVSIRQIHDCGIICENKEIQILEDRHIVDSGLDDLIVMEVDDTVRTHNQEALDLDKQQTMEETQDLRPTIKDNKMTMPGDAIMPSCSEFQINSPETKISEVVSTKGIQIQEHLFIKEELALEKELCKITDGNASGLDDRHIVDSGLDDLVMEVDEAWSTVRTHNEEALDLDKQQTMEKRQDLRPTIKDNKMTMPGDAIMPSCSEFQINSPETKINEVVSTKGIQSQEHLFIKEEQVLECKITEGNARPLVVTNVLGAGGVDTTLGTVDVNKSNCVEGIQNQEACSSEEMQAKHDQQQTGVVGDVRILQDTSTNYSGNAGTEKDLCMEKGPAVLEKQDKGTRDENTKRTLVNTDASECGEADHDGTMQIIYETDSTVQAVNMADDKISSKSKQNPAVLEKQDKGTTDETTERTLVDTDAPECGEAEHDGTMKMIHETDSKVQAVNMAEGKISSTNKQNPAVLEKHKGTTDENRERTLVDTDAPECGEAEHDGIMKMIHQIDSTVQAVNMVEDKIPSMNKQNPAVLEKQDKGMTDENTERILLDTDAPECGEAEHDGTMKMIHEIDSTLQAVNTTEDKILSMNKQNPVVLEKQDKGTTDENTERILVDTDGPECGEAEHDGTMKMIHETDSTVQAVNMADDKIASSNIQNPAVLEKQDEGTTDENKERTLVGIVAPECGEAKYDGTMKMIHETDSAVQADHMAEEKISLKKKQNPAVLEKQDEGTIDENTERTLVDTDTPESGEVKHDGTMKMIHETDSTVQAVNLAEDKISFKNKQKVVPLGHHDKSDVEGSGSKQTTRNEFKGALQPDFEHEEEVKQEIIENKTETSGGRKNDEASEQEQTSAQDATIVPSGIESNNEWAEEPIKSYGKCASDPANTGCQTSKVGRPSIEEVRKIHSGRSVYLKEIKESLGRIRAEPSNRTHTNNAGYYSRHGVQEPVTVNKGIKVPLHDTVSVCGRDRALELVTGPPEETPRWRQEQCALNILEDVQNARIAEKTKMEMEIRILKAQIVSMQKQVMNMDQSGEVISRSKRH